MLIGKQYSARTRKKTNTIIVKWSTKCMKKLDQLKETPTTAQIFVSPE